MRPFDFTKAPFPWFGGKRHASAHVWAALGDPVHYVEPFAGTLAVLLTRPHPANRAYYSETASDRDGLLVNFWRSVVAEPGAVADAASWPVTEADKTARSCAVLKAGGRLEMDRLMGDPSYCDPVLAGWWVWCVCCTIGAFGAGGPWWPDDEGRLARRGGGVKRQIPHLSDSGQGVNAPQLREPGIIGTDGYHPMTMPTLTAWIAALAARLRHVRVIHGDWRRSIGTGAAHTIGVRTGDGPCGVFLDPPYTGREDVYNGTASQPVAVQAAEWAVSVGSDPKWRIAAAGYTDDDAHSIYLTGGWTEQEWYTIGYLTGGYKANGDGHGTARRERLYLSPHCLQPDTEWALFQGHYTTGSGE